MGDALLPLSDLDRPGKPSNSIWIIVAASIVSAAIFFFVGQHFGFASGFQAAYVPEHSHYLFEQRRANGMQNRISGQKRCLDKLVSDIPSLDTGGLAGLAEIMRNVALLERSMMYCNEESGFGVPSQGEISRILPSSQ